MAYIPDQGDIVYLDFSPQTGHEQAGRRPALVLSSRKFSQYTNFVIACPITNSNNQFPLHIFLDHRTKTTGVVLTEQVKSLDLYSRNISYKEKMPDDITEKALKFIKSFF